MHPQIPDQSMQVATPPQSDSQGSSQSAPVASESPQVPSSTDVLEESTSVEKGQEADQSLQDQNQSPDQSTGQSPHLQTTNQGALVQIPPTPPTLNNAPLSERQQNISHQNLGAMAPATTPGSQPAQQPPFSEYATKISKTNSMYPNEMIVGAHPQSAQPYLPPGDTNSLINSTGMTNLNFAPVPPIPPVYSNPLAPVSHHQERAALQQQLQELFCIPPAPEVQDKIIALQEKLQALQQHEANDQCSGGPQCILQSSMFTVPAIVDSPQVTSTTGRGRSKGTSRSKKSRKKADKEVVAPVMTTLPEQQPVSENLVTPGDSSLVDSVAADSIEDLKPTSGNVAEEEWVGKGKKAKPPRKPRAPKPPKEPKEPKEPKVKKEKEPKAPKEPKIPKEPKPKKKKENKDSKRSKK